MKISRMYKHSSTPKPHQCVQCKRFFSQKYHLKTHMLTHTNEKPHECEVCHRCFARKDALRVHMFRHTRQTPRTPKCGIHDKAFAGKSHLNTHLPICTKEKLHKCETCHESFAQKSKLRIHMLLHTKEKPYKCKTCNKRFSERSTLYRRQTHAKEKLYECEECLETFAQKYDVQHYMSMHPKQKFHECGDCGKIFLQKAHLRAHMLTHTNKRKHECEICFMWFLRKANLNSHMITHRGQTKEFEVYHKFSGKSIQHVLTHLKGRAADCEICRQYFVGSEMLPDFALFPTEKKKCEYIINSKFLDKGNLIQHVLDHMKNKTKGCEVCKKLYSQDGLQHSHILSQDNVDVTDSSKLL